MRVNADFGARAVMHASESDWVASPMPGVHRRMLDRVGGEVARATSIVRYDPGSAFSAHVHDGGEEYLVLEGTFQDQHGDFPVGSYVRNPPTSSHTPASAEGATIFVKLRQFAPDDRVAVHVDTATGTWSPVEDVDGVVRMVLHRDERECVVMERWVPGTERLLDAKGGLEMLVLDGEVHEGADVLGVHGWLRLPAGATSSGVAGDTGARVWIKTGHLASPAADGPTWKAGTGRRAAERSTGRAGWPR